MLSCHRSVSSAFWPKARVVGLAALLVGTGVSLHSGATEAVATLTCTNLVSGYSWQIKISLEQRTVDANPAEISGSQISWRDGERGPYYALDRKSGELTVTFTSSTGGYFIRDRCTPPI